MKTFAEFRSNKFPPYGDDELINPGLWGKRLAEYFVAKLPAHGLVADEPIAEDWGWYLPVNVDVINQAFDLSVTCADCAAAAAEISKLLR